MTSVSRQERQDEKEVVLGLIERFEKDIYYGCHSLRAEYTRSQARQSLEKLGAAIIEEVVNHIWHCKGIRSDEVKKAWEMLLNSVCSNSREAFVAPRISRTR